MKVLIITVAGSSTRFSRSIGRECLKCIYHEGSFEDTLLYMTVHRNSGFDKYVIVGGYKFGELEEAVSKHFEDLRDKIILVENEKYAEYGSGYSLYLGLKAAIGERADEIVFAEGDLWTDKESFDAVSDCKKDVVTFNRDTIDAQKSVVFYFDGDNRVHYLYDTAHNRLEIKEPFLSVYNSGQIWKFNDAERIKSAFEALSPKDWQGTNLVFVQKYFGSMTKTDFELRELKAWLNCNTVEDFRKIRGV